MKIFDYLSYLYNKFTEHDIKKNDLIKLKILLKNFNYNTICDSLEYEYITVINYFVYMKLTDFIKNYNGNINIHGRFGNTPLHISIVHSPEYVPLLLEKGAKTNSKNVYEETPAICFINYICHLYEDDIYNTIINSGFIFKHYEHIIDVLITNKKYISIPLLLKLGYKSNEKIPYLYSNKYIDTVYDILNECTNNIHSKLIMEYLFGIPNKLI